MDLREVGKHTEYRSAGDITFMFALVSRVAAFGSRESDSDSESEESSEEDDSETGFFVTGFGTCFGFGVLAAYREGNSKRGRWGGCELPRHLLRLWQ